MPKLNPKDRNIARAETQFVLYLHSLADDYELTPLELMELLTSATSKIFRVLVKEERQSEE